MVNFRDPAVVVQDSRVYTFAITPCYFRFTNILHPPLTVAMTKLWHAVGGLYM